VWRVSALKARGRGGGDDCFGLVLRGGGARARAPPAECAAATMTPARIHERCKIFSLARNE
jgi:hypothetical protein